MDVLPTSILDWWNESFGIRGRMPLDHVRDPKLPGGKSVAAKGASEHVLGVDKLEMSGQRLLLEERLRADLTFEPFLLIPQFIFWKI